MSSLLAYTLVTFGSVFSIVDPFAAVPIVLARAGAQPPPALAKTALRASATCFLVLSVFAVAGNFIFSFFGITLPAFKIAGGLILGIIGLDMLQAKRSPTKETPGDAEEAMGKDDVGIVPLGIPMLAGPGSISTVMVLMSQNSDWPHAIVIFSAIAVISAVSYVVLSGADWVGGHLGESGIRILTRMMGLLLLAIAVQFVLNGIREAAVLR
jgi:multiple antibiotic resistance protein